MHCSMFSAVLFLLFLSTGSAARINISKDINLFLKRLSEKHMDRFKQLTIPVESYLYYKKNNDYIYFVNVSDISAVSATANCYLNTYNENTSNLTIELQISNANLTAKCQESGTELNFTKQDGQVSGNLQSASLNAELVFYTSGKIDLKKVTLRLPLILVNDVQSEYGKKSTMRSSIYYVTVKNKKDITKYLETEILNSFNKIGSDFLDDISSF